MSVEGRFRINNVPPGNYEVGPLTAVYILSERPGSRGKVLAEGENVDDVNFEVGNLQCNRETKLAASIFVIAGNLVI